MKFNYSKNTLIKIYIFGTNFGLNNTTAENNPWMKIRL